MTTIIADRFNPVTIKKVTLRQNGWDVVWECIKDNGVIWVWHTKDDGKTLMANSGFNTIEDAVNWMEERIQYLYPDANRYAD